MVLVVLLTSPVSFFVGPNDDVRLAASNDVSHFVSCPPLIEVTVRHVKSSAPADEVDTQFNELFSMFATLMCVVTATA